MTSRRRKLDHTRTTTSKRTSIGQAVSSSGPYSVLEQLGDSNNDHDDDDDDEAPLSLLASKQKTMKQPASSDSERDDKSVSDDDEEEEEEKEIVPKKKPAAVSTPKKKPARRHTAARKIVKTAPRKQQTKIMKKKKKAPSSVLLQQRDEDDSSFDSADDQISYKEEDDDSKDEDFSVQENEEEESSSEEEEEEEEYNDLSKKKSRRPTTTRKAPPSKRTRGKRITKFDTSSEEEEESFEEEEEEEETTPVKKKKKRRSTARNVKTKKRSKTQRRKALVDSSSSCGSSEDDDDEEEAVGQQRRRGTPSRASAKKASLQLSRSSKEEINVETFPKRRTKKKKKKKADSDEEEFVIDEEEEQDDEIDDDNLLDDDVDAESEHESEQDVDGGENVGIVKDSDIGDADDSDSDGERPVYHSPQLKVTRRAQLKNDEDEDDASSSLDDEEPESPQQQFHCPSEVDIVTQEELPDIHVCFTPPDGKTRQCFALETLRKIALTTQHPQSRVDFLTCASKQTFLQPPHFRTEMSDDLLDQIASRFGRDALDLNGSYYNRKVVERTWNDVHRGIETMDDVVLERNEEFTEQLKQYIRHSFMGSQDVYCCPLCYIVAHRGLKGTPDDDAEEEEEEEKEDIGQRYPVEFSYPPMTVLGFLDNDNYKIASVFCFKSIAAVKKHLRNDHHVETKVVEGNEIYKRFKVRAPDGLLQRYLTKRYGETCQGDMMRYWFEGNNELFLLLVSQMAHSSLCRDIVKNADNESDVKAVDKAEEFLQPALDYFASFQEDASDLWKLVANPFRRATKEEIREFIANDGEEEEENNPEGDHRAFYAQAQLEEFRQSQDSSRKLAERYERMEREHPSEENDEDAVGSEEADAESEDDYGRSEDDVANGGHFEESSEEDDEWEKNIMEKSPRKRKSRRVSMSDTKETPKKRSAASLESDDNDDNEDEESPTVPASSMRKRLVIDDSDED